MMARSTGPTAAIAGITPGVQAQGAWTGRRQLFVRFAGEAETAVLYNGEMLAKQMDRAVGHTALHSIDLAPVLASLSLLQVTFEFGDAPALAERALTSLRSAANAKIGHALVLAPRDATSDGQVLRLVEQAHDAVPAVQIVLHPSPSGDKPPLDRRYSTLIDQAMAIHRDVVFLMRVPGPVGVR
jgi:hypothetical protein